VPGMYLPTMGQTVSIRPPDPQDRASHALVSENWLITYPSAAATSPPALLRCNRTYDPIYRHRDIPRQEESFRLRRSREIALLPRCEGERRPERIHRKVLFIASKSLHLRVELNNSAVESGPWCQPCSLIESDDRCKGCLATPCLCRWDIRLLPDSRASSGKFIGQKVRVAR